jgi:hypothetical protein
MNKNKTEALNIIIIRLMFIFLNKLHLNRLEFKKLVTTTLEVSEQINAADSVSFTENLTQALSLQVIT